MYRRLATQPKRSEFTLGGTDRVRSLFTKSLGLMKTFRFTIVSAILMFIFCSAIFPTKSITSQLSLFGVNSIYSSQNDTDGFFLFRETAPRLNKKSFKTIEKRLKFYFPYDSESNIENNIWQIWEYRADHKNFPKKCFALMENWRKVNQESNHNLITIEEAETQIFNYFSYDMPEVIEAYNLLPDIRLKFEFLKYLIVYTGGGIYADIDTLDVIPVKLWHQSTLKPLKMMVGINVDYNDASWDILYNKRLSFSTKVFQSKSHHPFFAKLIARIVYTTFISEEEIKNIAWKEAYQNVDSNGEPLIQFIGESIFTDTLFSYFNELREPFVHRIARTENDMLPELIHGPETNDIFSYKLFTLSSGPTQVDDVIVMPQLTFKGPSCSVHKGKNNKDNIEKEMMSLNNHEYYYVKPYNYLDLNLLKNEEN